MYSEMILYNLTWYNVCYCSEMLYLNFVNRFCAVLPSKLWPAKRSASSVELVPANRRCSARCSVWRNSTTEKSSSTKSTSPKSVSPCWDRLSLSFHKIRSCSRFVFVRYYTNLKRRKVNSSKNKLKDNFIYLIIRNLFSLHCSQIIDLPIIKISILIILVTNIFLSRLCLNFLIFT